MDIKNKVFDSIEKVKSTTVETFENVKTDLSDQVEKFHGLQNKDYSVWLTVDKNGVKHQVKTNRPTRHTIKWKSKGQG